jgi:hypothetical protein
MNPVWIRFFIDGSLYPLRYKGVWFSPAWRIGRRNQNYSLFNARDFAGENLTDGSALDKTLFIIAHGIDHKSDDFIAIKPQEMCLFALKIRSQTPKKTET